MFRITFNKSHIYSYYNSYFLYQDIIEVSCESPESLFLRPISFFKSLFCSGQFLSKFQIKFRTTSLQNTLFAIPILSSSLCSDFCSVLISYPSPELNLSSRTPFLLSLFLSSCSCSVLDCSYPSSRSSSELNLSSRTPFYYPYPFFDKSLFCSGTLFLSKFSEPNLEHSLLLSLSLSSSQYPSSVHTSTVLYPPLSLCSTNHPPRSSMTSLPPSCSSPS
jgi:hypothetical protein